MTVPAGITAQHPLGPGDPRTDLVTKWQRLLVAKSFVIVVDGVFGDKTTHATKVAQNWAKVPADGLVGPVTWKAVEAKQRTKRPISTGGNIVKPKLGIAPKIIDARNGRAGFPKHPTRTWNVRSAGQIIAKVGHYTGGPASFISDAKFHVTSDYLTQGGAPAIAYTLGIDKDGTLFVFNDWRSITWHCDGGKNTSTLGIVFRGAAEGPSAAQKVTLRWLYKNLAGGAFQPFKKEPRWPKILLSTTHKHITATSCPGELGESFYKQISGEAFRTSV